MSTWKCVLKEELGKNREGHPTHCVFFYREYEEDWGYMGMRDYMTLERTESFEICVVPYEKRRDGSRFADTSDVGYKKKSFRTRELKKDMANRIWWNIKNGISYEALVEGLREENMIFREA